MTKWKLVIEVESRDYALITHLAVEGIRAIMGPPSPYAVRTIKIVAEVEEGDRDRGGNQA